MIRHSIYVLAKFSLLFTSLAVTSLYNLAYASDFEAYKVSLVYPQLTNDVNNSSTVNFIVRGNNLNNVTSMKSYNYLNTVINAIKQADMPDWFKDIHNAKLKTNSRIALDIIDVKLNGEGVANESTVFGGGKLLSNTITVPNLRPDFADAQGNKFKVYTQAIFYHSPSSDQAAELVAKLNTYSSISDISLPSGKQKVIKIFYIHCEHGVNRTGYIATSLLLKKMYDIKSRPEVNNYHLINSVKEIYINGQVKWCDNHGKVDYTHKVIEISGYDHKIQDYFTRNYPGVDWQAPDMGSVKAPFVNQYAWTLPFCQSGFSSVVKGSCLDFDMVNKKIIWNINDMNALIDKNDLCHYELVFVDDENQPYDFANIPSSSVKLRSTGAEIDLSGLIGHHFTSIKKTYEFRLYYISKNQMFVAQTILH